eukprot:86524_1
MEITCTTNITITWNIIKFKKQKLNLNMSTTGKRNQAKGDRIAVPTQDPDSEYETNEVELQEEKTIEYKTELESNNDTPKLPNKASQFVVNKLEKNTKAIIFPSFVICAIASAVILLLGFINIFNKLFGLIIIMILTIVTAYIAMYGIYKWGEVDEHCEHWKQENTQYGKNTNVLKDTRKNMKEEVTKMQSTVSNLESQTMELNKCIESFDELHEALLEVCGDDEEILNLIDKLNEQYTNMKLLANQKDKAQLLLAYYRVQFGGHERGKFGKDDYERFVGRLNVETRELYDKMGGFDAMDLDKNGNVDPNEFMRMTSKVLENNEENFIELTKPKSMDKSGNM